MNCPLITPDAPLGCHTIKVKQTKQMTLTQATQFDKLVENYVSFMMDGMDTETMQVMVYDLLTREYQTYTQEQIVSEIVDLYDDDLLAELMPTVED